MVKSVFRSILVWLITGVICGTVSAIVSGGNMDDFYFVLTFLCFFGLPLAALISGILSQFHIVNPVLSLAVTIVLSAYIGYEFRYDIGFWNFDGGIVHFLKIVKNCIIIFPVTYFGAGYLCALVFKKMRRLFSDGTSETEDRRQKKIYDQGGIRR